MRTQVYLWTVSSYGTSQFSVENGPETGLHTGDRAGATAGTSCAERRLQQIETAMEGIARHVGNLSIVGPCMCGQSLLLVRQTDVYCPGYGHQQVL